MALPRAAMGGALATVLGASAGVLLAQADVPTYQARRVEEPVRIDGRLDEPAWALAPRVGAFRLITDPARPPAYPTDAAVLWDDTHLYVAFASSGREAWGRYTERDARLWEEEVVEVFLDPDGDGRQYAEIEVSPHNVVVDLLIAEPRAGGPEARRWDVAGLQTAIARHADGWVAEMAIPWAALGGAGVSAAPAIGDTWRVGLYRITRPGGVEKAARIDALVEERRAAAEDRRAAIDATLRQLRADDEYAAWSPTQADRGFHDPERFGRLVFAARVR
ncbi:carbohydrate-binding family 9-like protein [Luteitalea sp. TBR-22]|uniref:carbohydrate-binding family 9-like protein n=1 Tax=Luteitalea sp. TBR-22 TaxID=2802971 RepID=UPI001EF7185F|nr:carbohydrate-binding family 9-like protein [Luteitalea sp. TBR-22]